jgi:hypothetical protein
MSQWATLTAECHNGPLRAAECNNGPLRTVECNNGPLREAECNNEIIRDLANCSYQNQKESKYLDTVRAATGILIDQVGNYQPLKDDKVPCIHYISRGLSNVAYEVHSFIFEGSTYLTPSEISPHLCNTRILYLPTYLSLISFSFSLDLSNRLFQGSFPSVFIPLQMSNMCFFFCCLKSQFAPRPPKARGSYIAHN